MRLFLGIEIPDELKHELGEYVSLIKNREKGWEKTHDYHLTLFFIGEIPKEQLPVIQAKMNQIKVNPFYLQLGPLEFFNRRILYISLYPSKELERLKLEIDDVFQAWQKPHTKSFIPHITIKRWQRYEYDEIKEAMEKHPFEHQKFEVRNLTLFEAKKDLENNKYHVIFRGK
jgi:2'-5' RNA ligase